MLQPGIYLKNRRYQVLKQLGKGGFGYTYRVSDRGQSKVLKILIKADPKSVELFRREAQVLSQLNHPGIPKVEPDGYFEISGSEIGQSGTAHCLIMEEVPGATLDQVIDESDEGFLEYLEALDWLQQLAEILRTIHSNNIFHRDIKPNNIIKRPDGQLVLIDFGAVRERTDTFLERRAKNMTTDTRIYARGYTSPEQIEGKADFRSDFHALGRTFIYLLTGQSPTQFSRDEETGRLNWRSSAPQISSSFADLIDWMTEYLQSKRPQNANIILDTISKIKDFDFGKTTVQPKIPPSTHKRSLLPTPTPQNLLRADKVRKPTIHLIGGLLVAIVLLGLRGTGLLRTFEFAALDQLMQWRPLEPLDERLLIVEIDQESLDFQAGLSGQHQGSLADVALNQALNKLLPHQPRAIGLDIYRDFTVDPDLPALKQQMQTTPLFAVCFSGDDHQPAITPPPEVPAERIGFSDFAIDRDGIIRRQLVGAGSTDGCSPEESLNFQLVMAYLETEGFSYDVSGPQLAITNNQDRTDLWPRITGDEGLYTAAEALGFTMLLNYRATGNGEVARRVSLQDLLTGQLDEQLPDLIKDRVILIGNTIPIAEAGIGGDYHQTPYGTLPGVVIHGHMISQMLSAIQNQRPILNLGQEWMNLLWILGWTALGSSLALAKGRFLRFLTLSAIALGSLLILSWLLLLNGLWLPLVYPFLGVSGSIVFNLLLKATALLRQEKVTTRSLDASSRVDLQRSLKSIEQLKNG
jgi:CHASE2 domain-containing sensor protein/tRNA A-37 threonylcarbamoyl transferase component Bud32